MISFVFFGTDNFSTTALEELKTAGLLPVIIVTAPDRPKGRHLKLSPPPVKVWAEKNGISYIQPNKMDASLENHLSSSGCQLFIVASFGKILREKLLEIPKYGALNIHPSLLPKYRGPSPVSGAILNDDKNTGVTIMLMEQGVDTGPILAEKKHTVKEWPAAPELEAELAKEGAKLLVEILPDYLNGHLKPSPQDDLRATYTKKLEKENAEIDLNADSRKNFLKIQAHAGSAPAFFFVMKSDKRIRVKITSAKWLDNTLKILRVVPEGKKETNFQDFMTNLNRSI
ncbi:MAG: methionyl-tRNA formyltransferase [bacterium]|nr:methionyl-tRNA formyltransferase [bacterium]